MNYGGIPVLPGSKDAYGNDMLPRHQNFYQLDWWCALMDIWVLQADVLKDTGNVFVWAPVDHDRFTPGQVVKAQAARGLIAMSLDGKRKMEAAGFEPYYVPHGVDSKIFQPTESSFRVTYGIEDKFVVSMVMANKGSPSRKAFSNQIAAFAEFRTRHTDTVLYLHTDMQGMGGENIHRLLELNDVPHDAVRIVSQYHYLNGMINSKVLAGIYTGSDVVMNATMGEGFGIPIVEAQMCFPANTEIEATGVLRGIENKYTGRLLQIETPRGLIEVTPDHPFMTDKGWVLARDLTNKSRLLYNKGYRQVQNGDTNASEGLLRVYSGRIKDVVKSVQNNDTQRSSKNNGEVVFVSPMAKTQTWTDKNIFSAKRVEGSYSQSDRIGVHGWVNRWGRDYISSKNAQQEIQTKHQNWVLQQISNRLARAEVHGAVGIYIGEETEKSLWDKHLLHVPYRGNKLYQPVQSSSAIFSDQERFNEYGNRMVGNSVESRQGRPSESTSISNCGDDQGYQYETIIEISEREVIDLPVYNLTTLSGTYNVLGCVVHNCGCPVITTNFSAMPEITKSGWSVDWHQRLYTPQEAYQVIPDHDALVDALEQAYKLRGDEDYRLQVRADIMEYDADNVTEVYWKPVIDAIGKEVGVEPEPLPLPTEIKRTDYMPNGLQHEGSEYFPARNIHADYALRKHKGKPDEIVRGWGMSVDGIDLDIDDDPSGGVAKLACWEAVHEYGLHELDLQPGDVVFDVGAQVGVMSIYLALAYPGIKVYAFEPMPQNYSRLQRNIKANGVEDSVVAINKAMTGDGRKVTIAGDPAKNSGGASIFKGGKHSYDVASTTLQDAIKEHKITGPLALLKLDCEGAEYEILNKWPFIGVRYLRGEVHPGIYGHSGDLKDIVERICDDYRMVVYGDGSYASEPKPTAPDVSVIIPSLNGHETIQRAIDAALNQVGVNMEVVICDDGSTPPLADVITPDDRVKVIRHDTNMGQVTAMNTATKAATGKYFIFHGDDDWLERDCMGLIVDEFRKQPASVGFVYGAQRYHELRSDTVIPDDFDAEELRVHYYPLNGIVYRRSLFAGGIHWRKTGEYNALEDWDYCLQVVDAGYTGKRTRILILHYTLSNERGWSRYRDNKAAINAEFRLRWPVSADEKVSA